MLNLAPPQNIRMILGTNNIKNVVKYVDHFVATAGRVQLPLICSASARFLRLQQDEACKWSGAEIVSLELKRLPAWDGM